LKNILIIEDSQFYQIVLLKSLKKHFPHIEFEVVETYAEIKKILKDNKEFDLVIADVGLPDSAGEHIGELAKNKYRVIVLTGQNDEDIRERMFEQNIVDFINKIEIKNFGYVIKLIHRLETNRHKNILIVDDSRLIRNFYNRILNMQNLNIFEANDGEEAFEIIKKERVDLVLSDYNMPNMDGLELLRKIREDYEMHELPFIGVSSDKDSGTVSRFLKLGANDYLRKPFGKEELMCRINNTLDMLDMFHRIKESAVTDALTGMHNRHYLYEIADNVLAQAKRLNKPLSLVIFDIDHFKKVNDTYGHAAGDKVLKSFAQLLKHRMRKSDIVVRYGGEEFIAILPNTDKEMAHAVIETIRNLVKSMNIVLDDNNNLNITVSAGIAQYRDDKKLDKLINRADELLYSAKKNGRNRVEVE